MLTRVIMMKTDMNEDKLKFSHHALVRQVQREIGDSAVSSVMQCGLETVFKDTKIITDQNVKIVLGKDNNTVITINKNTRNTRFLLSERTKQKEESLLYKIKRNNDHAMCELAQLYLKGELGERNIEEACRLFERAARMGNSHAMCKLSQIYKSSSHGVQNQKLADKFMRMAAEKNNVFALGITGQRLLAKYLEKYPIKSNIFKPSAPKREILQYLNKAADKGSTRAIWQLGNIYEKGCLGEKDLSKAKELYVRAAKLASPTSLDSLHEMCLAGTFSFKELEEILDNISLFLHDTSLGMAFQLGTDQLFRKLGRNPIRGLKLIEQAALKQYDEAILLLIFCYKLGVGSNANLKLAQYWNIQLKKLYDDSAKSGNAKSHWKLGELYLNDEFHSIDLEKSELCFKEAIEKTSHPEWIYFLGGLYLEGKLGDKPINVGLELIAQAIKMWQLQAASGLKSAIYNLGYAYDSIGNREKAVYWYSKAPSDKINAQLHLAEIYLDNLCHEKNISMGLKIIESVILDHGTPPSEAFETVGLTINAQTIPWLQGIADNITEIISEKNLKQYNFQKFVLAILARVYETGELVEININYDLASKYNCKLLVNFNCIKAGKRLVHLYNNKHLPTEYYDTIKKWVLQIPVLLDADDVCLVDFIDCIWILGKLHKIGDIFPCNIQEATKWLYLVLYHYQNDDEKSSIIKLDIEDLPPINYNQKVEVVSELSELTKNMKITSLSKYKVMSRILGDIFYDGKIINQNIDESIYWYTESANTNNGLAAFKLAKIYQNDKQYIDTAIEWYMLSTQLGNKNALNILKEMVDKQEHISLSSFLNRYQYRSVVEESELANVEPLGHLKFYPNTSQKMFELGKCMLDSGGKDNILNAAFWFRKAMKKGIMEAALELHSMYKSASLGINLVSCADRLYLDILKMCYSKLKKCIKLWKKNISDTLPLLNCVSSALKISDISTVTALNRKIEALIHETNNINTEALVDAISDLETITAELYSQSTIPDALDVYLLAEDISNEMSL